MTQSDADFPHDYAVQLYPELPGDGVWHHPVFYIPKNYAPRGIGDGGAIKVTVGDKTWIGYVKGGDGIHVIPTPNPGTMVIDVGDGAYYVPANNPDAAIELPIWIYGRNHC